MAIIKNFGWGVGGRGQKNRLKVGHLPSVYPVCSPGELSSGMEFSLSLIYFPTPQVVDTNSSQNNSCW